MTEQIKKSIPAQEMRITDAELQIIKSTFSQNDPLLKLMRKIFLPEIYPTAPLGQNIDLWMTIPINDISNDEALINLKARNSLIQHVDQQLMVLKTLAGAKEESVEDTKKRLGQNSNK